MKYPIFILEKNDCSMRMHLDEKSLNHYEQTDLEKGLYVGWDFNAYPFKVLWIEKAGIKIERISDQPQPDVMREAISRYIESTAAFYRPDKPFVYEKTSSDFIGIFESLKQHIQSAPLKQKVINFLRRF